jgi:hypothetical protein
MLISIFDRSLGEVMSTQSKPLDELVRELPADSQAEVREFVEFLLRNRSRKAAGKLRQSWAGALSDFREDYSSLELQKKSLDWRSD